MKTTKRPKTRRTPTSIDVAKAAGVSRSTVEFVLNQTPGQTISASTRGRVLKAVAALGYHPNAAARTLRKGTSRQIAMFATSPMRFTSGHWIAGLQERACNLGYHVGVYYREDISEPAWRDMLAEVLSQHPAGVIAWAPLFEPADREFLQKRISAAVFVSAEPVENALAVRFDSKRAARVAATHLVERGHRHIALTRSRTPMLGQAQNASDHRKGLHTVLDPLGGTVYDLPVDPAFQDARRAVEEFRRSPHPPTAVYAHQAEVAVVLLKAFEEFGLRVPEDMALISAEDSRVCELVRPALTCVRDHLDEVARQVVDIVDALARGQAPSPELLIPPPPELIVRDSS